VWRVDPQPVRRVGLDGGKKFVHGGGSGRLVFQRSGSME
jgi:hypothetical protein